MTIKLIIKPREKDLGGFSVRRVLPFHKQQMVGPWIFFDHMGPAHFPSGEGINVRPHPHINLATVTYLFAGEIFHRDSLGSSQPIHPGDINLMVAGKGIVHSEREREEVKHTEHELHGLQLWHVLPEKNEEIEPAFYHYPSADIPQTQIDNIPVRVMMGSAYGLTSPVKTFAETLYVEAHLKPGQTLTLPKVEEQAIYVASGNIRIEQEHLETYNMAILENHSSNTVIEAVTDAQIAIIGGEKMPKRFIEWNFVSSRKERIEQAKDDWKNQRFPKVPGDEEEFIPLP
ncbi:MAG: pirin family protein [Pseudomonadota bacterium]